MTLASCVVRTVAEKVHTSPTSADEVARTCTMTVAVAPGGIGSVTVERMAVVHHARSVGDRSTMWAVAALPVLRIDRVLVVDPPGRASDAFAPVHVSVNWCSARTSITNSDVRVVFPEVVATFRSNPWKPGG